MKAKLQAVVFCAIAALMGAASAAIDNIQHGRQSAIQLHLTCKTQPRLDACIERAVALQSVRYFFNGQEYQDGFAVLGLGTAE
jgi:hypothetical protein